MGDLAKKTAEVVINAIADAAPAVRDDVLAGWYQCHRDTAVCDLQALARRTDDRTHRALAQTYSQKVRRAGS